jgi:hypothetical protein
MEFIVLTSSLEKQLEREKAIFKATVEVTKALNGDSVSKIKGKVDGIKVYMKEKGKKTLIYEDCNKTYSWKEVYYNLLSSVQTYQISRLRNLAASLTLIER